MAISRTPPPQRGSFQPASENATYRDLLLFEERLKTNAALLGKRKSRYQFFLIQLLLIIIFLLSEVFLQTRLLSIPYKTVLKKVLPNGYRSNVRLHPYLTKGMLLVAFTTLVLFFASGLYSEKIGYADRYVHHANRTLRNFNMHLNVRHPPLPSRVLVNPFSSLSNRDSTKNAPSSSLRYESRSPSLEGGRKRGQSVPIPPIPPSTNPRGELIFSARVDRSFRESYERYRASFERKREERELVAAAQTWWGWQVWPWNWLRRRASPPKSFIRGHSPSESVSSTTRGRGSDTESGTSTPGSSRRPSPVPSSFGKARGGSRAGMPPGAVLPRLGPDRRRTESFSFLLAGEQNFG